MPDPKKEKKFPVHPLNSGGKKEVLREIFSSWIRHVAKHEASFYDGGENEKT